MDLALYCRTSDPNLDVIVNFEPKPGFAVLACDLAVHARRRDNFVADMNRLLQLFLLADTATLWPNHEEIHRERDEQEDAELKYCGASTST